MPADYIRLASMITDPYSLEEAKWVDASPLNKVGDMDAALDRVNATRDAALRPAVDKLTAGRQRCKEIVKAIKEAVDRGDQNQKDLQDRADRGEFIYEVEERKVVGYHADGAPIYETVRRRVDGDFDTLMVAGIVRMATGTPEMAKATAQIRVRGEMERSRLEAWDDLAPKFAEIYGQRPARADLAVVRIAAGNPGKPNTLAIVNTGGKLLTDVTVAVKLVHFTHAPHATSRQQLFLRQWPANQTVYLNSSSGNIVNTDKNRWRPGDAMPGNPGRNDSALLGVGGVVEARVTVWAAEAHQSEHAVKYPDVVRAGGRFELDALNRVTEREIMQELMKAHIAMRPKNDKGQAFQSWREKTPVLVPPEFKTLGPNSWIFTAGPRISELVRGTALEPEVQAFRADAVEIIRQRRQKQFDCLAQAAAPSQQWSGTWAFRTTPANATIPDVLKPRVGSRGRIALTFEATPAPAPAPGPFKGQKQPAPADDATPRVTARIFDPERPDSYRPLIGEITYHHSNGRLFLHLKTPPAPPPDRSRPKKGAPPARKPNPPGQHTLEHDDVSIELTCDENGLKGVARTTGDRFQKLNHRYQFELVLKSVGK